MDGWPSPVSPPLFPFTQPRPAPRTPTHQDGDGDDDDDDYAAVPEKYKQYRIAGGDEERYVMHASYVRLVGLLSACLVCRVVVFRR